MISAGETSGPPGVHQLRFVRDVAAAGLQIPLSALTDLSMLPPVLRASAAKVIVVARGGGQGQLAISTRQVGASARAQLPALSPWIARDEDRIIRVRVMSAARTTQETTTSEDRNCLQVVRPVSVGSLMRRGDFQVAACGRDRVAFSYDHTWGVARAARDLEPGDITPRLPTKALAESVPGQEIYLRTRVGPVVVERAVHVVEPARLGRGVIVRAQDGNVFAVPALAPTP